MIIKPLINQETKKPYTNVELCKIFYEKLVAMRDGIGYNDNKAKEQAENDFYRICGGSANANQLMPFLKQIVDEPDPDKAQKLFVRALEPVILKNKKE